MTDSQQTYPATEDANRPSARLVADIETLGHRMASARDCIGRIIFGQIDVIDHTEGGLAMAVSDAPSTIGYEMRKTTFNVKTIVPTPIPKLVLPLASVNHIAFHASCARTNKNATAR